MQRIYSNGCERDRNTLRQAQAYTETIPVAKHETSDSTKHTDTIPVAKGSKCETANATDSTQNHVNNKTNIDFQKAFDQKNVQAVKNNEIQVKEGSRCYLSYNKLCYDVPELNETKPFHNITVRANKSKTKLKIQQSWNGSEIYKYLSHRLEIPLDKLKLIHKGKVVTEGEMCGCVRDKSVFQAIGWCSVTYIYI